MKAEAFQVNQQRLGNCPAGWKVNIQTRCLSLLLTNGPAPQGMINWNDCISVQVLDAELLAAGMQLSIPVQAKYS